MDRWLRRPQRFMLLSVGLSAPLVAALSEATTTYAAMATASLFGREACPVNMFQCSTSLGAVFSNFCCENGQYCSFDADNQPACCPVSAICTGTAPDGRPTAAVSFIPNPYFSFPYAPTSFKDREECTSAVSACSRNYEVCTSGLQGGGGFAVTIDVPGGGGTTVGGGGANLGASATPICSSLSSQACGNLVPTSCDTFESASLKSKNPLSMAGLLVIGAGIGLVSASLI